MNPTNAHAAASTSATAASSSSKYFDEFDNFLQKQGVKKKCSSSSAAAASSSSFSSSSSSLSTTVFERFSAQFDKQYGRPRCPPSPPEHGSSNKFTDDAPTIIVDMLTRDRQTQKPIEIRQQEFARSLKAREMHIVSTKQ